MKLSHSKSRECKTHKTTKENETMDMAHVPRSGLLHPAGRGAVDGHRPVQPRTEHQECRAEFYDGIQHD